MYLCLKNVGIDLASLVSIFKNSIGPQCLTTKGCIRYTLEETPDSAGTYKKVGPNPVADVVDMERHEFMELTAKQIAARIR